MSFVGGAFVVVDGCAYEGVVGFYDVVAVAGVGC